MNKTTRDRVATFIEALAASFIIASGGQAGATFQGVWTLSCLCLEATAMMRELDVTGRVLCFFMFPGVA